MGDAGFNGAAQSVVEQKAFMEAFARVRLLEIIEGLTPRVQIAQAVAAVAQIHSDWDDVDKLASSGIDPGHVDADCRRGRKYLHIDVAAASPEARAVFLASSGLSDKQQRDIFTRLYAAGAAAPGDIEEEVQRLNRHLDWLRRNGADTSLFPTYHSALGIHGRTQNTSGAVGAMGAAMTFLAAIREIEADAIIDVHGRPPAPKANGRLLSPEETFRWIRARGPDSIVKAILLRNGRALVFRALADQSGS